MTPAGPPGLRKIFASGIKKATTVRSRRPGGSNFFRGAGAAGVARRDGRPSAGRRGWLGVFAWSRDWMRFGFPTA